MVRCRRCGAREVHFQKVYVDDYGGWWDYCATSKGPIDGLEQLLDTPEVRKHMAWQQRRREYNILKWKEKAKGLHEIKKDDDKATKKRKMLLNCRYYKFIKEEKRIKAEPTEEERIKAEPTEDEERIKAEPCKEEERIKAEPSKEEERIKAEPSRLRRLKGMTGPSRTSSLSKLSNKELHALIDEELRPYRLKKAKRIIELSDGRLVHIDLLSLYI